MVLKIIGDRPNDLLGYIWYSKNPQTIANIEFEWNYQLFTINNYLVLRNTVSIWNINNWIYIWNIVRRLDTQNDVGGVGATLVVALNDVDTQNDVEGVGATLVVALNFADAQNIVDDVGRNPCGCPKYRYC